ncbi:MAG: TonB-dependent receptor [Acidobacteriia bacterium]|nr:TonB-dependent receptor [Terriglobia bacterium]
MRTISIVAMLVLLTAGAWAQATANAADTSALEQKVRDLEDRLISLEGQLRTMKDQQAAQAQQSATATAGEASSPGQAAVTPQIAPAVPTIGGAQANAKALNPDISAIGDFIGSAGRNSASPFAGLQPFPGLSMHESELGVQAIVDPYARADFFLSFGEEGVDLEEGYITFTSLPAGLVAKVGKMRAAFGKVNSMHNHVLPWIDRPLVTFNLVGGEDGIDDAGISIQRILPAPKGIFLEATGQVFRGDSGTNFSPLFTSSRHSDVSTVAHLRGYGDLTESTNLDLGLSYSRGHNDLGTDFLTNLYGFDATLRWKPLRRAIYHSFIARTEAIWSQRQQLPFTQRSFGMYASADYQLGRRWFVGGRYDYSQRSTNQNLLDRGFSSVLTYWPSEFAQIRGQFRRTQYGEGNDANELLMQVQFSIGAHGAHPF